MTHNDVFTTEQACEAGGWSLPEFVSILVAEGMLLLHPEVPQDDRCQGLVLTLGTEQIPGHVLDCECRFVPAPHPDVIPNDDPATTATVVVNRPGFLKAKLSDDRRRLEVWVSRSWSASNRRFAGHRWYSPVQDWLDQNPGAVIVHSEGVPYQGETRGGFLGGHDYTAYEAV